MNGFNEVNQAQNNFEPQSNPSNSGQSTNQPAGFCQNCGQSLTVDTIRRVGQASYCEPCLAARIGAPQPGTQPGGQPGYVPVKPAYSQWAGASGASAPGPNPGLAAFLGLIPGVGAMYNEQYAKGIVHLIVFAVLVSFADNVNGIFGLLVAGWIFYMAIEAYHTARARRDGTPLPNPFGLNDIGERLGFGKSWPSGPSVAEVARDAGAAAAAATAQATAGFAQQFPHKAQPVTPPWGAAPETYAQPWQAQYPQPAVDPAYNQAYRDLGYGAVPTSAPHVPVASVFDSNQRNRFPAGAIWLIGLGTVFLLTTTGIFRGFRPDVLTGFALLGLAIWIFLRRLTGSGSIAYDGSVGYRMRVFRASRAAAWIALFGILVLLNTFNILTFHHSWPFFIIFAGVMAILERILNQSAAFAYIPYPSATPTVPISGPPPAAAHDSTQGGN